MLVLVKSIWLDQVDWSQITHLLVIFSSFIQVDLIGLSGSWVQYYSGRPVGRPGGRVGEIDNKANSAQLSWSWGRAWQ